MNRALRNRAVGGILYATLLVPEITLLVLKYLKKLHGGWLAAFYAVTLAETVIYIYFMTGYRLIGEKTKNSTLVIASWLIIAASILGAVDRFLPLENHLLADILIKIALVMICGAVLIPFGIGLLKLKEKFGPLATALGVLNLVAGASLVFVIFFFVVIFIFVPLVALEIIFMFKAAEKLK